MPASPDGPPSTDPVEQRFVARCAEQVTPSETLLDSITNLAPLGRPPDTGSRNSGATSGPASA
jgi:hypothetical protein